MKVVNIGCFFLAGYYFRPAAQDEKGEKYELAKTEASTDTSSVPSTDLWFLLQQALNKFRPLSASMSIKIFNLTSTLEMDLWV